MVLTVGVINQRWRAMVTRSGSVSNGVDSRGNKSEMARDGNKVRER